MGVGKTTVCQRLKMDLPNSIFLDGDWCWDASPFLITDEIKSIVLDNICHLLNNFLNCSVYENIIFCWVMHKQSIIDSIVRELNTENCIVNCISLIVDENSLKDRLTADVLKGVRNSDVIERSLLKLPMYNDLNTIKINTSEKSVQMIVDEIKAL